MTSSYAQVAQNGSTNGYRAHHTVTGLSRWSIANSQLPAVDKIKAIHVYDFDNTLFRTPLPNPQLWNGPTIGTLANPDAFANGGWWHDSRILAATGEGLAKEEPRGWAKWWNEKIIELVQLSNLQKDALCVLLTGRSESGFGDLIKRMVTSRSLGFDMISLKPAVGPDNQRFPSTMIFKQRFLETLMETYKHAAEIRIYEDRPKHVKGFRDFMTDYNKKQTGTGPSVTRGPILAEVIQVAELAMNLDPVVEVAEVQHMINEHNDAIERRVTGVRGERLVIRKTVFYTGYLINAADTEKLLSLAHIPPAMPESELKFHANNIMICPRPCPNSILEKVGGMGSKMTWEVTGIACFENSIWAACVKPVPPTAKFHSDNKVPLVVLALRKGARPVDASRIQNWQPVPPDKAFVFETTVGEKVLLRIEPESSGDNSYESLFPSRAAKRKNAAGDGANGLSSHGRGGRNEQRHYHHQAGHQMGRGGSNQGRFRGGGANGNRFGRGGRSGGGNRGGRGGGRGGHGSGHHYKSLDDVGGPNGTGAGNFAQQVSYEDDVQPRGGGGYAQSQQENFQQPQHNTPTYYQPAMPQYQPPYHPQQLQQIQDPGTAWQPRRGGAPGAAHGYAGGNGGVDVQNFY